MAAEGFLTLLRARFGFFCSEADLAIDTKLIGGFV
jgi:hypothetical protein